MLLGRNGPKLYNAETTVFEAVFSLGYKGRTAAIKAAFCIGGVSLARKLYKGKQPSLDRGKELANTRSKSEHVTIKK